MICQTDCERSELIELHQDVLALENIHIPDNEVLLSGKQVEEIKSELIKYKEEIEASDNYLNLSMCSGLTMTVLNKHHQLLMMFVQHFKNSVLLTELWKNYRFGEKNMQKRLYRL